MFGLGKMGLVVFCCHNLQGLCVLHVWPQLVMVASALLQFRNVDTLCHHLLFVNENVDTIYHLDATNFHVLFAGDAPLLYHVCVPRVSE